MKSLNDDLELEEAQPPSNSEIILTYLLETDIEVPLEDEPRPNTVKVLVSVSVAVFGPNALAVESLSARLPLAEALIATVEKREKKPPTILAPSTTSRVFKSEIIMGCS